MEETYHYLEAEMILGKANASDDPLATLFDEIVAVLKERDALRAATGVVALEGEITFWQTRCERLRSALEAAPKPWPVPLEDAISECQGCFDFGQHCVEYIQWYNGREPGQRQAALGLTAEAK